MTNFNFRTYVLNENKVYLAKEIGDVLNSSQELADEVNKIGTRNLVRYSQIIVNKCRGILQGHWGNENRKFLKSLQKCAIALAKSIDENDNIENVLKSTIAVLQQVVNKMGVPVNAFQITKKPAEMENPRMWQRRTLHLKCLLQAVLTCLKQHLLVKCRKNDKR